MAIKKKFILTIFGATGSLAHLKIYPAIYKIMKMEGCEVPYSIIGYSRTKMTDDAFREIFKKAVKAKNKDADKKILNEICKNLFYHSGQYDNIKDFIKLRNKIENIEKKHIKRPKTSRIRRMFYLSIPPIIFKDVVKNIDTADLKDRKHEKTRTRLIIEKPFGHDQKSAQDLNKFLIDHFKEKQIYRIDHYLGKEAVQNMMIFRFANSIMEPLFNSKYISNVQITAAEDIGIEDRAGYFDNTGILRDMIQPHVMQILSLIAMCRPSGFTTDAIKSEKAKLLRCIRPVDTDNIDKYVVRGQYGKGTINGKKTVSYLEEKNVKKNSQTESYCAVKFFIDNHRWFGVPFYLRSGKRINKKLTEVNIEFKNMPALCTDTKCTPIPSNILTIRLQPDEGMFIKIVTKKAGEVYEITPSQLTFFSSCNEKCLDAYSRLIMDAINGYSDLFIRFDEIETAWSLIDPIIEAFKDDKKPKLHIYKPGTWGPKAADDLLKKDGYEWINH